MPTLLLPVYPPSTAIDTISTPGNAVRIASTDPSVERLSSTMMRFSTGGLPVQRRQAVERVLASVGVQDDGDHAWSTATIHALRATHEIAFAASA